LTPEEFDRRYRLRPDIKKAELIFGVVYVASPVSADQSGPHARLMIALGRYEAANVEWHDNPTVIFADGSRVQPDVLLRRTAERAIDWWALEDEYVALARDEAGVIRSRVFPGLDLDIPAILPSRDPGAR
jgi:hypothetical protein